MVAPGPSFLEVLWHLPSLFWRRLAFMYHVHEKYGDIVRLPFGPRVVYAVFHPDLARQVLISDHKRFWKGRTFQKTATYLGDGLATSEGAYWKSQRRRMNPDFHRRSLASLSPLMIKHITALVERLDGHARSGQPVDLREEFARVAMEVVTRTMLGSYVDDEQIPEIVEAFQVSLRFTARRALSPVDIPEALPIPSNLRFRRAVQLLDAVVYGFIEAEAKRDTPSDTLLGRLMAATDLTSGERMQPKQLRNEAMTIFLGGTDTTGNTLSWSAVTLDRHPAVRAKVDAEIAAQVSGAVPTPDEARRLPYLQAVLKETLRQYPQNWVMSRDALVDVELGGHTVPAGSTVFIGTHVIHHRPDLWEEPAAFRPERFLGDAGQGRHPLAWFPFGAGPRKCIGMAFATLEMSYAIPMIRKRFELELLEPDRIDTHATWSLWPRPRVLARVHAR